MEDVYDVIVVGGGLAGLRSTYLLEQKGYKVLLLEASNRVGGRTTGTEYDNYQWDLGGQWIGPTHDRMYALLEELGMNHFPQNMKGKKAYLANQGKPVFYEGIIPPLDILTLLDLQIAIWKMKYKCQAAMSNDLNVDVWEHPEARELDSLSVHAFAKKEMWTQKGIELMNQGVRALLTSEAHEVSMLYWIHFLRLASRPGKFDGWDILTSTAGGAQQDRIKGGSYMVSQNLAKKLKSKIIFDEPVTKIQQKNEGKSEGKSGKSEGKGDGKGEDDVADVVVVTTEKGNKYRGKFVVLAFAPLLSSKIVFEPPMPTPRDDLTNRMPLGKVIKCLVFYKENFWRKKGFSGEVVSENDFINMGFEATLSDDSHPALVGFICGEHAIHWSQKSEKERGEAVCQFFAKFFGSEALKPIHYMDMDWTQQRFARGGYTSICGTGVLSLLGNSLRTPVGRIHFAGTETARRWTAYMEGALESAERVTEELNARLQGKTLVVQKPEFKGVKMSSSPWGLAVFGLQLSIFILFLAIFYQRFWN